MSVGTHVDHYKDCVLVKPDALPDRAAGLFVERDPLTVKNAERCGVVVRGVEKYPEGTRVVYSAKGVYPIWFGMAHERSRLLRVPLRGIQAIEVLL